MKDTASFSVFTDGEHRLTAAGELHVRAALPDGRLIHLAFGADGIVTQLLDEDEAETPRRISYGELTHKAGHPRNVLRVSIAHDPDCPAPNDGVDCSWLLYSFSTRHVSYRDPETLGLGGDLDPATGKPRVEDEELAAKLQSGLAFFLSYYEHGDCCWMLADGAKPAGVEFVWDGRRHAGLLVFDGTADDIGARTYEERRADAEAFLETYTNWCNGDCWMYDVEDDTGESVAGCGGFYDLDDMLVSEVAPELDYAEWTVVDDDSGGYAKEQLRRILNDRRRKREGQPVQG